MTKNNIYGLRQTMGSRWYDLSMFQECYMALHALGNRFKLVGRGVLHAWEWVAFSLATSEQLLLSHPEQGKQRDLAMMTSV